MRVSPPNIRLCDLMLIVIVSLLTLAPVDQVRAAKFNRVLNVGDKAPAWRDLPGADGKRHSLEALKQFDIVVVVFFCNHCPVAKAYEERLLKLAAETRKQSVQFVLLSVSRFEADRLEEMTRRVNEKKYPFPYLQDQSQQLGRKYGAYATPQVFVLDRERKIAYMGAIDDSMFPDEVTEQYLSDAISAVLKKQDPEVQESKPIGCHIEYD
ncbi:redoxin domain-containing protein [bacterium]|nr:redoxin domain-containing protein [bacterium]